MADELRQQQNYEMLGSAAQLGTAGAGIGFAVGGPVGAAVGAGIGGVGGLIYEGIQGPSDAELQRQEDIEELKRRQDLGALGLTDEERAVLQAQLIDPVRAQQRGAALQQAGVLAATGGGPATAARMAVGEQQRIAEQLQPSMIEIQRADLAKAAAEEELLRALQQQQADDVEKAKQQAYGAMLNAAASGMGIRAAAQKELVVAGQAKAAEEFNKAFSEYAMSPDADPAMTMLLMGNYGFPPPVPTEKK